MTRVRRRRRWAGVPALVVATLVAAALPLRADRVRVIVAVGLPESRPAKILSLRTDVVESLESATDVEPWGRGAAFAAEIDRADFERLSRDPRVRAISIDRGGQAALMDSVPFVGANLVHAKGFDGRGVTVAVLDSGIDTDSPDFAGRIVGQQCFCDNLDGSGCCPNGDAMQAGLGAARDDDGHGTHVSGIVAGNGATAPRGVAPGARIVAVKVLDHNRVFRSFTQIYRALEWIAAERPDVKVINMSFGSWDVYAPAACDSAAVAIGMHDIVAELRRRGVLITASSGNQSSVDGTTIRVQAAETVGHYAEWLELRASQVRKLNRMTAATPVVIGRKLKMDFSKVTPDQFEARRTAYHRQLQEAFFTEFRISGDIIHTVKSGESIWVLAQQRYNIPIWLLRQYNPDLDLGSLLPGARLVIPLVEATGISEPSA